METAFGLGITGTINDRERTIEIRSSRYFRYCYELRALSVLKALRDIISSAGKVIAALCTGMVTYLIPLSAIIYRRPYYIWIGIISGYRCAGNLGNNGLQECSNGDKAPCTAKSAAVRFPQTSL